MKPPKLLAHLLAGVTVLATSVSASAAPPLCEVVRAILHTPEGEIVGLHRGDAGPMRNFFESIADAGIVQLGTDAGRGKAVVVVRFPDEDGGLGACDDPVFAIHSIAPKDHPAHVIVLSMSNTESGIRFTGSVECVDRVDTCIPVFVQSVSGRVAVRGSTVVVSYPKQRMMK